VDEADGRSARRRPAQRRSVLPSLPSLLLLLLEPTFLARNAGLLLIATAQLGFSLINMCVKLLERDVQVPVWQVRLSLSLRCAPLSSSRSAS